MNIAGVIERVTLAIMHAGIPLVYSYQLLTTNVFLNVEAEDAAGLEKSANFLLTPVHYAMAGRKAIKIPEGQSAVDPSTPLRYKLVQKYSYDNNFVIRTTGSLFALPFSLMVGSVLKGISYFSPETRARHQAIVFSESHFPTQSNNDYYRSIGLEIRPHDVLERIDPPRYTRRPGDEQVLGADKEALREIIKILKEKEIPFWVDCGTCLGAFRYGGVIPWDFDIDMAVLEPDFENVKQALKALDHSKYVVQDWSGRTKPNTYLKVWVKQTGVLIDIYHFRINTEDKTLTYIISNEDSIFLTSGWKERERRYATPVPYDVVFPLKKADFDGIEVYVPGQTKKYLESKYGDNIEPVKIYHQKSGRYERDPNHPYWKLGNQR